jgi:hypothetical protein
MIWVFVLYICILDSLESSWFYYIVFCWFHRELVYYCYFNSTRIMCMFRCAHYAWWAFPKRHRVCCGVSAMIRKVAILGRHTYRQ